MIEGAGSKACRNTWTYPGEINVVEILRLWTYAQPLGLLGWAKMRYNLLGQAEHWFPGTNAAPIAELVSAGKPATLNGVLAQSPFAAKIPRFCRKRTELCSEKPVKRLGKADHQKKRSESERFGKSKLEILLLLASTLCWRRVVRFRRIHRRRPL